MTDIDKIKDEFFGEFNKLPKGEFSQKDIPLITTTGALGAIFSALCHAEALEPRKIEPRMAENGAWKNDITDELESAEEKYRQYKESGDPLMLDMSRQELEHASYYLNRAKMSSDQKLREKLPEYQASYDRLERMIKEPHGDERLPIL
jgi:hypothetical protein